uniref:Uncharacterized protein n=1 Tax=Rhodopseudomonas palustris (strain BisA53) TaxID=316055 RepID=Q07SU4_RHOP5
MAGIRVIQLQEFKPAPPLYQPWNKNRRLGNIVAPIDAAKLAQTRRVSSYPAIPDTPVKAAAARSWSTAFSSTDSVEALRLTVQAPIDSRRCNHATELLARFFLRRSQLERWKGSWLIGVNWIGDDVMKVLVANKKAIGDCDRVILAMVSSDASGR